jgi:hypothetical protein
MQVRLVSTLTRDDEDVVAEALFEAAKLLLKNLPIRYFLEIETTTGRSYSYPHPCRTPPSAAQAAARQG